MVMDDQSIKEFSDLYEKEYGVRLSEPDSRFKVKRLKKLFRRIIDTKRREHGRT